MTSKRKDTKKKTRAKRERPTPKWLLKSTELDSIAQRRCLMVLDVLSGTKPVTDAIAEAKISRGMYYQLEERALKAMLSALLPGATETGANPDTTARIVEMEERIRKLEQEKRRAERMVLLTRKVIAPGPVKTAPGRPPGSKNRPGSKKPGKKPSPSSTTTTTTTASSPSPSPSIPTPGGASAP